MGKLGKRQMILLGVMAIVILYAAFEFLAPKKKTSTPDMTQKTTELKAFATNLTAGLGKDMTKNLNALIFNRAEKEWTQDPFLDAKSYRAWSKARELAKEPVKELAKEPVKELVARELVKEGVRELAEEPVKDLAKEGGRAPKIEFTYTGYLDINRKRIAIINGMEYEEGAPLDIEGFALKSVSPASVVIENLTTRATLNIPLHE